MSLEKRIKIMILLVVGLSLISCGKPEDFLIGKWFDVSDPSTRFEFYKDGTVVMRGRDTRGGDQLSGQYTWIADKTIKMTVVVPPFNIKSDMIMNVEVSRNKLVVADGDLGKGEFQRVSSEEEVEKLVEEKEKRRAAAAEEIEKGNEQVLRELQKEQTKKERAGKTALEELQGDPFKMCKTVLKNVSGEISTFYFSFKPEYYRLPADIRDDLFWGQYRNRSYRDRDPNYVPSIGSLEYDYGTVGQNFLLEKVTYKANREGYTLSCEAAPTCVISVKRKYYKVDGKKLEDLLRAQARPDGLLLGPEEVSAVGEGCPSGLMQEEYFQSRTKQANDFFSDWNISPQRETSAQPSGVTIPGQKSSTANPRR